MEAFLAAFELEHPIHSLPDLRNGTTLFEFPQIVYAAPSLSLSPIVVSVSLPACSDAEYFRLQSRAALHTTDNWVLRFSSLRRLYRHMTQYLSDIPHQQTRSLVVPDLLAMAQDRATLALCHGRRSRGVYRLGQIFPPAPIYFLMPKRRIV